MRSEIFAPVLLLLSLTTLSVLRCYFYYSRFENSIKSVEGHVLSHPFEKNGYQYLEISGFNVRTFIFPKYELGDYLVINGRNHTNKKVFYNPDIKLVEAKSISIFKVFSDIRLSLVSKVKRSLPQPYSGLILGMTIGYKDDFPDDFLDLLKKTGTIHVIVVSGYNISIVASSMSVLFGAFGRRSSLFLTLISVLLFAAIAGFDPSVVRATFMGLIALIGSYYGKARFSLYILYITLMFMLLIKPAYLLDISFQLSAVATLSVILCSILNDGKESLFTSIFMTAFVSFSIFPIISYYFGTVSLLSILSNIFVSWAIPFITIGGFFFFILPVSLLKIALILFIDFYLVVSRFVGSFDFGFINYKFSISILVTYYCVLLLSYLIIYRWRKIQ